MIFLSLGEIHMWYYLSGRIQKCFYMTHTLPFKEYIGKKVVATSKKPKNKKTWHDKNNSFFSHLSVYVLYQDLDTGQWYKFLNTDFQAPLTTNFVSHTTLPSLIPTMISFQFPEHAMLLLAYLHILILLLRILLCSYFPLLADWILLCSGLSLNIYFFLSETFLIFQFCIQWPSIYSHSTLFLPCQGLFHTAGIVSLFGCTPQEIVMEGRGCLSLYL